MALLNFEPQSDIEQRILDVQAGHYSADALMRQMADATLYIPSKGDVQEDGRGFVPVLVEQGGMTFVMVFTALSRPSRGSAPYLLQASGGAFFARLPPGYGVIFNPGYDAQLLLPPDGVAMLKTDLGKA
jgi:SseB protein N-terminal domain